MHKERTGGDDNGEGEATGRKRNGKKRKGKERRYRKENTGEGTKGKNGRV